jgi:hypothetical protein
MSISNPFSCPAFAAATLQPAGYPFTLAGVRLRLPGGAYHAVPNGRHGQRQASHGHGQRRDHASSALATGAALGTWFFVYNHLHTVHAIASCNAAEIAMGMLMEATVPRSHRWIPKAMTVQYLGKATTSLHARAQLDPPDFTQIADGVDLVVPVSVTDRSGNEVVHADITTWVTPVS